MIDNDAYISYYQRREEVFPYRRLLPGFGPVPNMRTTSRRASQSMTNHTPVKVRTLKPICWPHSIGNTPIVNEKNNVRTIVVSRTVLLVAQWFCPSRIRPSPGRSIPHQVDFHFLDKSLRLLLSRC